MTTLELIRAALGWCAVINLAIMLWWFLMIMFAGDFIHRLHSKWYPLSRERFYEIHYCGGLWYKMVVTTFFIIPYFALLIVG